MTSALTESVISVGEAANRYLSCHSKLVVVPNMGNAGDALINHSLFSLLRKRWIQFSVIEAHDLINADPNATYVLMVNGALHHAEHAMDRLIHRLASQGATMIFHSATIQDRDELLNRLPETTVILAREPVTFQYVQSVRPDIVCVLSEDATMAIADGDADLPNPDILLGLQYRLRVVYKTLQLGYPAHFALSPSGYRSGRRQAQTFWALRNDDERASGKSLPPENVDLSIVCGGRQTREHAEAGAATFLRIIKAKQVIRTDRLHVAVGCALVNVHCHFSANKYFKCKAIYQHSMARRFPRVKWILDS